jgi:hypothetical protein
MDTLNGYYEFRLFVNDPFNWSNANFKFKFGGDELDRQNKKLFWLPDGIDSPYKINSKGYRSDEFLETRDIVFAGCSQTWGEGVLYDAIWGNILSKLLEKKSYNIGLGGKSVQFIVQNAIAFCKEYGNPKALFCLFPEFTRIEMKSDTRFMIGNNTPIDRHGKITYSLIPSQPDPNKRIKYSKIPHLAEDIIPSEFIFSVNLDYINMLEIYCELNGIKLFWGTWDKFQDEYLNKNIHSMGFKNYVYLEEDKWEKRKADAFVEKFHEDGIMCNSEEAECSTYKKCHEDYKEKYGKNFDLPMDSDIKNRLLGHMAVHKHIHVAEKFEGAFKNASN